MRTQPISQSTVVPCMIHPPPPVRYLTTKRLPHGPAPLSSCAQQQASIHRLLSTYLDVAPSSEVVALYAPGACTTLPPKVPDPYLQGLTDIPKQTDFSHNRTRPMCRRIRSGTGLPALPQTRADSTWTEPCIKSPHTQSGVAQSMNGTLTCGGTTWRTRSRRTAPQPDYEGPHLDSPHPISSQ